MKKVIENFENKLYEALKFKYRNIDNESMKNCLINNKILNTWDIKYFYDLYKKSKVYPEERIKKLTYYLFDIKQQLYYLLEVDSGLYNELIYNQGYDKKDIEQNTYLKLIKLSLDQGLILKSRILWERIMNFIYFLEKGVELENKVSRKSSKKEIFFKFTQENKWKFLERYKDYIYWYDEKLRTPEAHKCSVLRKIFLNNQDLIFEKTSGILTIVMNAIWVNLLEIIKGKEPTTSFSSGKFIFCSFSFFILV